MSLWLTIPLAVAVLAVLIAVIIRRRSSVTALHIEH
jgi:hypothetical protein